MAAAPVKVRGGGYGLDAELARKAAERYDYDMENEAREWIEQITAMEIGDDFGEGLRDGVILCELVNKIHPGVVKRIESKSKLAFKLMENVSNFLRACRTIGVNEFDLFETVDLFELKDLGLVVRCLHALGRAVQRNYPNFNGPTLGVKEAIKNERQFTEEQLTEARNTPGLISLGSMRTMERFDVRRTNDLTFGADANRVHHRPPPPPPPPSAEKIEMVSRARAAPSSPVLNAAAAPPQAVSSWPAASEATTTGWPSQNTWVNAAATSAPPPSAPEVVVEAPSPQRSNSVSQLSSAFEKTTVSSSSPAKASPEKKWSPVATTPKKPSTADVTPSTPPKTPSPQKSASLAGLNSSKLDDGTAMEEAQQWIEAVLKEKFLTNFGDSLKDGVILCQLINAIKPDSVTKIQTSQMPFKQMENITAFIKACRAVGVAEFDLFETIDLFEQKNIGLVVKCIHALGRAVQKNVPEFTGPSLGVKEATVNKRTFSPAQLQEAAGAVPLLGQYGMGAERPHDIDRSASVTFGRDAAVSGLEKKLSATDVTANGGASRKNSEASESAPAAVEESTPIAKSEPSPLQKTMSKSSALPTRTVWT